MQENQTSNIAPIDPQVYAESLGADTRKKYRMFAYASTWFGCFTDVVMDNSAIIILYLAMLGGSESMIMLSTSLVGMVSMFLLIPTARIVDKLGAKRVINISCYIAMASYLMMASGAFLAEWENTSHSQDALFSAYQNLFGWERGCLCSQTFCYQKNVATSSDLCVSHTTF